MNEQVEIAILQLLADSVTTWNWYKLDRALSARGVGARGNIVTVANSLAARGLIDITATDKSEMPSYSITIVGRKFLISCGSGSSSGN